MDYRKVEEAMETLVKHLHSSVESSGSGDRGWMMHLTASTSYEGKLPEVKYSIHSYDSSLGKIDDSPTLEGMVGEFLRRRSWAQEQKMLKLRASGEVLAIKAPNDGQIPF